MLNGYSILNQRLCAGPLTEATAWVDLLTPSKEEEKQVEALCGIEIPTIEEMREIEISSRLYNEDGATFMTAWVLSQSDKDEPLVSPITFILAGTRLITLRYHEPRFFATFAARAQKSPIAGSSADAVLVGLLEASIDRIADIIEKAAHDIDALSREIFGQPASRRAVGFDYRDKLVRLGQKGDLLSDIRESITSLDRLFGYLGLAAGERRVDKELKARVKTLSRDARSLIDHLAFVSQKVTFLLDATLGLINIEQNQIIKIFSVAAVVFLPPTLIASIYGMNFQFMPELDEPWAYPAALGAMVLSAVLPYLFFKHKGWL
ncbi:MAG: magnesium transport protein CorA [Alphaproteobacteria bacterium]|nr:MAG: magnesium transport protein CorA [Alphaproteobacteria bacterium]